MVPLKKKILHNLIPFMLSEFMEVLYLWERDEWGDGGAQS